VSDFVERYRNIWGEDPRSLLKRYKNQPELTKKLDSLHGEAFSREVLYEIVLWKLSRFPSITSDLIEEMKSITKLQPPNHEAARETLGKLLRSTGVALPMASTLLRFLNPSVFQIIDDRAYRMLLPGKPKYPSKPKTMTDDYVHTSTDIYFTYLNELRRISSETFPFESADRILYLLDLSLGNKIGQKI
jgi:hypothetical protein